MDYAEADKLVKQLSTGFETLQEEYQKLFGQHEALERRLATARDQYNELAKLYGTGISATPPLSLSSSPGRRKDDDGKLPSVNEILAGRKDQNSRESAKLVGLATCAVQRLRPGLPNPSASTTEGVKIWSGPSADAAAPPVKPAMPSISESPMEQDFTIEGMPSNLGCPFASMTGKKLSSHAASVLSRYKSTGSAGDAPSSTPLSSISRVNGRESFNTHRSRRESHRASFADPIKAEICGMSDHAAEEAPTEAPKHVVARSAIETHVQSNPDPNVCPIRFLDQHSPEEVATYFENHKHDLPRSHEICVKRYQSNEDQIRELDARYGNLVSMIQGLGAKHQPMLPADRGDDEIAVEDDAAGLDPKDKEKVRNWANSVSPPPHATEIMSAAVQDGDGNLADDEGADSDAGEGRESRFARPLRDIRVGESPSRPWGIPVPVKYLEKVEGNASEASSKPARIPSSTMPAPPADKSAKATMDGKAVSKGRCPFGFDQAQKPSTGAATPMKNEAGKTTEEATPDDDTQKQTQQVTFIAPDAASTTAQEAMPQAGEANKQSRMVFTGPVFIGYSAEDAAKILRESGMGRT